MWDNVQRRFGKKFQERKIIIDSLISKIYLLRALQRHNRLRSIRFNAASHTFKILSWSYPGLKPILQSPPKAGFTFPRDGHAISAFMPG